MRRSTTSACVITYAGIDYHKKFSVVTLGDQAGKPVSTHRLVNDQKTIEKFFREFPTIECAVESCRGYEWFVDLLKEIGMSVHLANPYEVALIAKSRCKTDKVDSRILMQLLAMGFLPTCYQPTVAERCLRERLRWRCQVVRNQTRIKIRIHSILDKENLGLRLGNYIFTKKRRRLLKEIQLQAPGRQELLRKHLRLLGFLEEMVEAEDEWISKAAKASPDAQLLMTIPGIGEFSALFILSELGNVSRFKRSSQVVNFAGLVPTVRQSGGSKYTGPITKQGPPMLRWILVQAAWIAIRFCLPLRQFFNSVSKRCGRNGAIIATARKLLEISYRVLRDQTPFDADRISKQPA